MKFYKNALYFYEGHNYRYVHCILTGIINLDQKSGDKFINLNHEDNSVPTTRLVWTLYENEQFIINAENF